MSSRAISTAIEKLAGNFLQDKVFFCVATVESVDEEAETCAVLAETGQNSTQIPNVRLSAGIGNGPLMVPEIGSAVVVALSKYVEPFVIIFSGLEKVLISSNDKIQFNDGGKGGLVVAEDLVGRLNLIEQKVNTIISTFNAHTHAANNTPTATIIAGTLTETQASQIENANVTHGD